MKYIDVEEMSCASAEEYDKNYSKGEYCHQQSFAWGFQEGCEFTEKEVEKRLIEKATKWLENRHNINKYIGVLTSRSVDLAEAFKKEMEKN